MSQEKAAKGKITKPMQGLQKKRPHKETTMKESEIVEEKNVSEKTNEGKNAEEVT